jgi:hypothetical protein
MTTTTTQAQSTASQHVYAALLYFRVNGNGYRQSFLDRLSELKHEWMRNPMSVDGLLGYANAINKQIGTEDKEAYLAEFNTHVSLLNAFVAMACEMTPKHREELKAMVQDRMQGMSKTDGRFHYAKALLRELSK